MRGQVPRIVVDKISTGVRGIIKTFKESQTMQNNARKGRKKKHKDHKNL